MAARDILAAGGPRKLLAIDGGGIRGALTLEVLARIEHLAREAYRDASLVLADCFDYFAGTSTGAIVATSLALGYPVERIRRLFLESGPLMFSPARWYERLRYRYDDEPLATRLKEEIGVETTLGSDRVRTLLLIMLRDATTDSPWPISNNPQARFNQPDLPHCNLHFPLWQLVRASTAAPLFFPPEMINIGGREHIFVDGGMTPYANPAFQLFLMATVDAYNLCWPTGEDQMLLVSLGTGLPSHVDPALTPRDMDLFYNALAIPRTLLNAGIVAQDLLCRVFGRCRVGEPIDTEVGDLITSQGPLDRKLFTYLRYDVELSRPGLESLGLRGIDPAHLGHLAAVDAIPDLQAVGAALAARVQAEHFAGFFPQGGSAGRAD